MLERIQDIKKAVIIFLLLVTILFVLFQLDWFWKIIYPLNYEEIIIENSLRYNLDPDLVSALVYVESRYDPDARSHKGARGLMQIMPDTGSWIAQQLNRDEGYSDDQLYIPEVNIEFGSWYLNSLNKEFNNELILVLAAYNAGRGNVKRWLEGEWTNLDLDKLPYKETREYVKQILIVYNHYKRLYNMDNYKNDFLSLYPGLICKIWNR
ncbi:lytic transglycosylase domain-containing protein [Iocasia frigidifontis]|uniref:lytic transglycosylase domain-containing protein n=1 Tax=Iocasia fonsfrigidae TaxID=2682810 RepID=UPI001E5A3636|nr:lytic transglycosylase domain-containing protein [Iocasia fonsfrigidae]